MSNDPRIIEVTPDDNGQRLDRFIKRVAPDLPYVLVQKLLRKGQIRIDGKRAKPETRLCEGQEVRLPPAQSPRKKKDKELTGEDVAFIKSLVIYDDGDIIAINKPQELAVQGGTKTERHIDGLLEGLVNADGVKPRLVHRLDKDTSGIMLLARSAQVAKELGYAFKHRDIKKIYWAIISPVPEIYDGTIKAPLVKAGGTNRERMKIDQDEGKTAITDYRVLETAGTEAAFVAFWPRTGRTHQLRAHAEYMNCPILGDKKYARRAIVHEHEKIDMSGMDLADQLHLHARRIILQHPVTGKTLDVTADLPPALLNNWRKLGFDAFMKDDPFEELSA